MASHYILTPTCAQPFSVMPTEPPALIPPSIHANKALRDAEEYKWLQNDAVAPSYAQELLRERLNRAPAWTSRMPGALPFSEEEMWELLSQAHQRLRVQHTDGYGA